MRRLLRALLAIAPVGFAASAASAPLPGAIPAVEEPDAPTPETPAPLQKKVVPSRRPFLPAPQTAKTCQPTPPAPLEAHLPFDGSAKDATGHCHTGRVEGATLTVDQDGRANHAYLFDENDVITLDETSSLELEKFTIALWVKPTELAKKVCMTASAVVGCCGFRTLVTKSDGIREAFTLRLSNCGGSSQPSLSYVHSTSAGNWSSHGPEIMRGVWHHIAASYDGTTLRLYVNGALRSSTAAPPPRSVAAPIRIGRGPDLASETSPTQPFRGVLDDVRIYTKALSDAEIAALPATR